MSYYDREELDPDLDPDVDPNSGSFIVDWLKQTGSDLDREHEFFFYMYFPRQSLARAAADRLASTGLKVDVDASLKDEEWLCLVACPQIPNERRLDGMVNFLRALSSEYFGNFDGWESSLEL